MSNNQNAIYDARQLGRPRMLVLGVQHMFAMFGRHRAGSHTDRALRVPAPLLFAGLGTLLFHLLTKRKVRPSWAPPSPSSAAIRPSPP